jgi:hypothetical protein
MSRTVRRCVNVTDAMRIDGGERQATSRLTDPPALTRTAYNFTTTEGNQVNGPPEFELMPLTEGVSARIKLTHARACTSLSDEAATERMNTENPTGIESWWEICASEALAPVACQERPDTHRHLIFEC